MRPGYRQISKVICFLQIIHDDERDLSLSEDDDEEEDDESQGSDKNKEGRTSSSPCRRDPAGGNSWVLVVNFEKRL